nr:EOG090X09MN [Lepidurus arcticus]
MDRFYYAPVHENFGQSIASAKGVRLYDGEKKSIFEGGTINLTPTHLAYSPHKPAGQVLVLDLSLVVYAEEERGGLTRSHKVILHLNSAPPNKPPGPIQTCTANSIKLSFTSGGAADFSLKLKPVLEDKKWEKAALHPPTNLVLPKTIPTRSGIVGIERKLQEKTQQTEQNISIAFQDLQKLMTMAKDMVSIAKSMSTKIKEKQGDITEDETVRFKSYLLSLGIEDPITKESFGSDSAYYQGLAKEVAQILERPIQDRGGMISLSDAYCLVNRARGLELISPADLLSASQEMHRLLSIPLRLRKFDSGLLVLQSNTQSDDEVNHDTSNKVESNFPMGAEALASQMGISVYLAKERFLAAERAGLIVRDDSIHGLFFFPNLILYPDDDLLSKFST